MDENTTPARASRHRWLAAALAALVAAGLVSGIGVAVAGPAVGVTDAGSNARSAPAEGGSIGTVSDVSASAFTLTTATGQTVQVATTDSTAYPNGSTAAGAPALVLGIADGTAITAAQVVVNPSTAGTTSPGGTVLPFQRGTTGAPQQVGQIPSDYTEGAGTIVSGATANQVTQAALAAYPGGVVDRVAQLPSGAYNVHYVGANWPHHIFVGTDFQVIGAS